MALQSRTENQSNKFSPQLLKSTRRYLIAANGNDSLKPWAVIDTWDSRAIVSLHKTLNYADRKARGLNRDLARKQVLALRRAHEVVEVRP
jgi:hypothetical protein